jgi:tetratricopeptide (TPR) repeat protein
MEAKRDLDAEVAFTRAIRAGPQVAAAFEYRARIRYARGDWEGTLEDVERATALGGTDSSLWFMRSSAELHMGRFEEAKASALRSVEVAPDLSASHGVLGQACATLKDFAGALAAFDRCIALGPATPLYYFERAGVHEALGDRPAAIADAQRCLDALTERAPEYEHVKTTLERLRKGSGAGQ